MARKRQQIYVVPPNRYGIVNKYGFGDFMNRVAGNPDSNGNITSGLFKGMSGGAAAGLGAAANVVGGLAGGLIGGGLESGAGSVIGGLSNVASAIPGPWGAVAGAGLKVVGGLVNRMFGSKLNKENINAVESNINSLNSFQSNARDYDSLTQNIMDQPAAMGFNKNFIGKDGWFSNKAKKKFKSLKQQQSVAEQFVNNSIDNNLNNISTTQAQDLAANFAALGGPLFMTGKGIMSPFGKRFAKGGTLSSPLHSYGANWTNGLTFVNNGNSHESNPYEGVQMGMDNQGVPNLVEEGEVIWNDYVFSNRIRVPKAIREKYKLRGQKDLTFADAVKKVQKESEERPNDPISQRGLDNMLVKLAMAQENERRKMGPDNVYAQGGSITIKPSKRGTFTAAATKHGMGVQEFASKVLANKENYSPAMVKKANFARNAAKWHAYGGNLYPLGGKMVDWVNGLSDADYQALLTNIGGKALNYKTDRAGLITYANTGKPGTVFNGITSAYNKATTSAPTTTTTSATDGSGTPDIKDDANYVLDNVVVTAQANKWKNPYLKNGIWDPGYYNWVSKLTTDADEGDENQVLFNPEGKYGVLEGNPDVPSDLVSMLQNTTTANNRWSHVAVNQYQDYLKSLKDNDDGEIIERGSSPLEWLRYVPALGGAVGVFSDLMGWTSKPDYSQADAVLEASKGIRDINPEVIGDYMRYTPLDRMFYLNQLNSAAGGTRRSLLNTSGGNRGQAAASILAADNSALNQMGSLIRQAEEYNLGQREKVAEFNRDTNKFNAEQIMRARLASAENTKLRLNALAQAYALRDAQDARVSAARSANLTNLFNSLGNIGIDTANRLDRNWLIRTGALKGDMTFKEQQKQDRKAKEKKAYGGRIKKRRGLTI